MDLTHARAPTGFLSFWTIVFSLIRQTVTLYVVAPVARKLGIRGESKTVRFMEQGGALSA